MLSMSYWYGLHEYESKVNGNEVRWKNNREFVKYIGEEIGSWNYVVTHDECLMNGIADLVMMHGKHGEYVKLKFVCPPFGCAIKANRILKSTDANLLYVTTVYDCESQNMDTVYYLNLMFKSKVYLSLDFQVKFLQNLSNRIAKILQCRPIFLSEEYVTVFHR